MQVLSTGLAHPRSAPRLRPPDRLRRITVLPVPSQQTAQGDHDRKDEPLHRMRDLHHLGLGAVLVSQEGPLEEPGSSSVLAYGSMKARDEPRKVADRPDKARSGGRSLPSSPEAMDLSGRKDDLLSGLCISRLLSLDLVSEPTACDPDPFLLEVVDVHGGTNARLHDPQ
jgi:hypothetical protein